MNYSREQIAYILCSYLDQHYANAICSLNYKNPLQLLIATILSAQCTDDRVNKVTALLFEKYKGIQDFANADLSELMDDVKQTGFFRNKANNIKKLANIVLTNYGGQVPDSLEELIKLPGVGRKTANVVLGNCFNKPGVVVDTHVQRIVKRLKLVHSSDPVKIEFEIMELVENYNWTKWSHQMIAFGRSICTAKAPKCFHCDINYVCDYYKKMQIS